jgi:hypothetical protein
MPMLILCMFLPSIDSSAGGWLLLCRRAHVQLTVRDTDPSQMQKVETKVDYLINSMTFLYVWYHITNRLQNHPHFQRLLLLLPLLLLQF